MTIRRLFLGLALASGLAAQTFIQMTDPQFGVLTNNKTFVQETANFEFAVATANRLKPDFVIITGDLIHKPGDEVQIAEYKRIAAKLDPAIKLYNVPGNHDVTDPVTRESLDSYRERFGPDYYSFRVGDLAGIALNSCLQRNVTALPEESAKMEAWLKTELEKARRDGVKHLVIFQHHPLFAATPDEPDSSTAIPYETRQRYLALFREYGVKYVFAGHTHETMDRTVGDLQLLTSGPITRPTRSKSGMRIVKVTPEGLTQRYYDFGELP